MLNSRLAVMVHGSWMHAWSLLVFAIFIFFARRWNIKFGALFWREEEWNFAPICFGGKRVITEF
jgi:hypothetical protein